MKAFLGSMTGGQVLMLALSIIAAIGVVVTFALMDDRIAQLIVSGLIVVILILGSRVAMPPEAHRMRAARYSIWVFGGILALIAGARPYMDAVVIAALELVAPTAVAKVVENSLLVPSGFVILATVTMFIAFLWFLRDGVPLGAIAHDPLIRTINYRDRRAVFVAVLRSHLERIDEELRWHHRDFVALRAEVDVRNAKIGGRRVGDLVEAIKLNRDADVFVVVGVPGAGKSVALRKCCRDLLAAQRPTERIPIYINLKEWAASRQWTMEAPPTDSEFSIFVRANVRDRLPDRSRAFFDEHFDRLVEAGEIFFMFDSFDEIPGVLDSDETSKLLGAVSAVIVRYLRGQSHGRGVIASRYYRRPRLGQEKHVQLDVRPFSERQISQAIAQSASRPEALKQLIFRKRPELGMLARNPFTLSLILLYWETSVEPPPNQSALFATYIGRSLADAGDNLATLGLDAEALLQAMADISWAMFESDRRGLEMTVSELRDTLGRSDIDAIVDALVAARLARKAARTQAVSFVHRRFNEYFLIARWLSDTRPVPFDAIPSDSRYRDALVLYAEVAEDAEAERLATFCWKEVESVSASVTTDPVFLMRAIYALRFLTEAFRARLGSVAPFSVPLGEHVRSIVADSDDILTRKIAVEAVGLLGPKDAEATLLKAVSLGNRWIAETAFGACRYLSTVPRSVEDALFANLEMRDQAWILSPDREFSFTLGIADSFDGLRKRFAVLRIELYLSVLAGIVSLVSLEFASSWLGLSTFTVLSFITLLFTFRFNSPFYPEVNRIYNGRAGGYASLTLKTFENISTYCSKRFELTEWLLRSLRLTPIAIALLFLANLFVSFLIDFGIEKFVPNGLLRTMTTFLDATSFLMKSDWIILSASMALLSIPAISAIMFGKIREFSNSYIEIPAILICFIITIVFLIYIIINIASFIIPFIERFVPSGAIAILPIVSLLVFIYTISRDSYIKISRHVRDNRKLRLALTRFNPSRALIAQEFASFETEAARMRYVRWLEREASAPEHLLALANIVTNTWPQGRRPNRGESEASILLAQLDARWIGLDA